MRLTNYSDYALRTLMYLASVPNQQQLVTISDIANSYHISKSHLTKIIHQLAKLGYIDSVRGKNGGIRLAKPSDKINLGKVLRHTESDFAIVPCFIAEANDNIAEDTNDVHDKHNTCPIQPVCHLQNLFNEATNAFLHVMDQYTLADITQNEAQLWQVLNLR